MYMNRIKKIRELRKMSVEDLARSSGIPESTLYRWESSETGRIEYSAVYRISKVLDCRMEDLIKVV